ncbi:restriction endonuclease [Alkalicaulis satelles]|uniref:Restriction endonuclease n=1 Tax=Alkalicaulis satelles TaxID=2609175 RepID=A0A5M6ZIV3_9PROT|nr:DpnI domain-containing protein [Alkalicaulis satelles]KAA5803694.1 restriction endonuclease [Alkalicaulis satelles]
MEFEFRETQTPFISASQSARKWTEDWAKEQLYCPACGAIKLEPFRANAAVADLFCGTCEEQYELKSSKRNFTNKIVDGAYDTMMGRLGEANNPNLLLLTYDIDSLRVNSLTLVPKFFFTPNIIEKRKALGPKARRAGWVGCNIIYGKIPESGKIKIVDSGITINKNLVLEQWKRTAFLQSVGSEARGWLTEVMNCVELIGKDRFSLSDVYAYEQHLSTIYPGNNNIRPKIRQQLQVLRDAGWLIFLGNGQYELAR